MQHDDKLSRGEVEFPPRWWETEDLLASIEDDIRKGDIPMARQRKSEKEQIALARNLALLACGNKLVDIYDGYLTIQSEDDGTLYWAGPEQSFREVMANVQKERTTVQGFSCEVVYGISEQGRAALSGFPIDWQQVLQRSIVLRPYPGSSKSFEVTLSEINMWWMASPQGDSNIYLYVETGGCRGIAFKKDNAALYRSGLLPECLDKRKFHNPYTFLVSQVTACTASR